LRRVRSRPLKCEEIVQLVTEYLEGALSRPDRRRFEDHISGCLHCSEFLRQIRTTIAITGALRVEDLSPELQHQFTALIRRWRSEAT
jgi:anti-sigma factor RsiW